MDLGFDLQQYISNQLKGSSAVDSAISQVFGINPTEMKLKEIKYFLDESGMLNFKSMFDPRSLTHNYCVTYEGNHYYGVISDEAMRYADTKDIVGGIAKLVMLELINPDPEYQFENENEQAMLDAAMDYGFV